MSNMAKFKRTAAQEPLNTLKINIVLLSCDAVFENRSIFDIIGNKMPPYVDYCHHDKA